ncbi:TIGR01777 family oxidoreductase [Microbacterium sp. MAHUQ-60]|uniref:TIGR01777 family oxidoreductase n=1 Tax=unclassified Microbacterium TaxID=2609290 RepID=UPI0036159963
MSARRVVISGAAGLIGRALTASLRRDDVEVVHLVRRPARAAHEIEWLTGSGALSPDVLAGADAVVNLNGASIARLPWTAGYRTVLRESRLRPTRVLAGALAGLGTDAPALLSASAVGYYGDRDGAAVDETAGPGRTFLAELCVEWERTALAAADRARVVLLRTAPLLHPDAVLKPMIALTRWGLGGPLGPATQLWPWISLTDEVAAIRHLLDGSQVGPVNLSGPTAATAGEIGRELAHRLNRPFLLPAPAWALRLGLSRSAADSLLLSSVEAVPGVLTGTGFSFRHRTAAAAIAAAL